MGVARLVWGVKQSFRHYVEGSGGSIAPDADAGRTDEGLIAFPVAGESDLTLGSDDALSGTGRFRGRVTFTAHGGMLSVTLAEPWIEARDGGWVLSIAETATRRTAIAKLDVTTAARAGDGALEIPAAITLDGMMIIGDHYPPGTPLDPVRLVG